MRIGLLGGTFDPVHKGHLQLAQAARHQFHLSQVYLVLSPRSPFKLTATLAPALDRLRMLRLALRGHASLKVGTWELEHPGPSYTVRTLARIVKGKPKNDYFLIMGSDGWKGFPRWKKSKKILHLATLLVGRRPGGGAVKVPLPLKSRVRVLKGLFPDISSTSIRSERGWKNATNMVPPLVLTYIRRHGLYGKID